MYFNTQYLGRYRDSEIEIANSAMLFTVSSNASGEGVSHRHVIERHAYNPTKENSLKVRKQFELHNKWSASVR